MRCVRVPIIIATGAEYRQLAIENASRFLGTGYLLRGDGDRSQALRDEGKLIVVGGGNSAGQAAVFLASKCRHVHLKTVPVFVPWPAGPVLSVLLYRSAEEMKRMDFPIVNRFSSTQKGNTMKRRMFVLEHLFLFSASGRLQQTSSAGTGK